jgi:hypothetical protein
LNVTKNDQIVQALADVEEIEFNADKTMIRRKNLDDLPEFQPKKKVKSEDKPKESDNPYDKLEVYYYVLFRVIFSLTV